MSAAILGNRLGEISGSSQDEVTELWVTGENDIQSDSLLKASATATLTWNGTVGKNYIVSILDSSGEVSVCPDKNVTGVSVTLSDCSLDDYSLFKIRVTPADANFVGLMTPQKLFDLRTEKLRWSVHDVFLLPNQSLTLSVLDGEMGFTFSSLANFNSSTLTYSVPITEGGPAQADLTVTDNRGVTDTLKIRTASFSEANDGLLNAPQGSSLTQPKEAVLADDGSYLVTMYLETARWQYDYSVLRSTNKGVSATLADFYIPDINSPTLSRAITKGPNGEIYSCSGGYTSTNDYSTIRKSVDNGVTWTVAYLSESNQDEHCYDVTVNSQGWVLMVGMDPDAAMGENGVVRLSKDGGATWEIIYKDGGLFFEAKFAPDNSVWIIGATQTTHIIRFLRGTYNGTNWSFTSTANPAGLSSTYYTTQWNVWLESGDFEMTSPTHGYFLGARGFDLLETNDSGATWTIAHAQSTGLGQDLLITAAGTQIMAGGSDNGNGGTEAVIYRKASGDSSFSQVFKVNNGTYNDEYCGALVQYADGDLLVSCFVRGWPEPAHTYISQDDGVTWTRKGSIQWEQAFDLWGTGYFQSQDGEVFAATTSVAANGAYAGFVTKMPYGTQNWSKLGEFNNIGGLPDPGDSEDEVIFASKSLDNYYYVFGTSWGVSGYFFSVSADGGVNWSQKAAPLTEVSSQYNSIHELVSPTNSKILLFASTASNRLDILESSNHGDTFTRISSLGESPSAHTVNYSDVLVAADGKIWLAVNEDISGSSESRLYQSSDQGMTWVLKHSEPSSGNTLRVVQIESGAIFLSGSKIFKTTDNGSSWSETEVTVLIGDMVVLDDERIVIQNSAETWTKASNETTWLKIEDLWNLDSTRLDIEPSERVFKIDQKTIGIPYYYVDMKTGYSMQMRKLTFP